MKIKSTDSWYYIDMNMIRLVPEKRFDSAVHQAVWNGIYDLAFGCFLKNMISNHVV